MRTKFFIFLISFLIIILVIITSFNSVEAIGNQNGGYTVKIVVNGEGYANVTSTVISGLSGNTVTESVGSNSSHVFVIEKYSPVKITELPIGSYFFDSFSGTFVNSTNESIIFTPTGNGVEYVNFSQSSVGLYQNGSSMIRYLIDIVLAVGTFMIVLIGLVVGIDFMAGNEKEKAWDRLIAWLIAAFLFYGAMAGGPLIWGWLHLP